MILAVDPGLGTFGWAIVTPRTGAVVACGVLISKPDPKLGKHADRVRRAERQAEAVDALITTHRCGLIAAEEMSFAPRSSAAAKIGIGLSWGNLIGLARARTGRTVFAIPPKTWQRAVVPAAVGEAERAAIDYARVERELADYVDCRDTGLLAVAPSNRNHAIDAVGLGVYTAIRGPQVFHGERAVEVVR